MKKKELVDAISQRSGITKNGDSIVLPGFASLSVKERAARTGRNPSTGQPLNIPASKVVSFKAGAKLKEAINA